MDNSNEKISNRIDILRKYAPNERALVGYEVEEGTYEVKIDMVLLKENCNKNRFIQFSCKNLGEKGPRRMYSSYYLTEKTEESSITNIRCLLNDFGLRDLNHNEVVDDYEIIVRLQELVGKNVKLVVEDQNGFMSSQLYKEIPNV